MHIGITQRVVKIEDVCERRDTLDQRWTSLLTGLGLTPILLPNMLSDINAYLRDTRIDGVVLTGGDDILDYATESAAAPERDRLEKALIEYCMSENLPLIGICRGFQSIVNHFHGKLRSINHHVAVRHQIRLEETFMPWTKRMINVNSFHNLGIFQDDLPRNLKAQAWAENGTVEAATVRNHNILGIMWHPEREEPTAAWDKELFRQIFDEHTL